MKKRGVVLVILAIAAVVLLIAGLAVDLGIAYVTLSKLSKAVDAGALAGARHAASSKGNVQAIVQRIATANFGTDAETTASYAVSVTTPATDMYQVSVSGSTKAPTLFARLMEKSAVDVVTFADAIRYPLDLTLVLDVSGSLHRAGAFDDLQAASKTFIEAFDDSIDQVGIVAYSTCAWELMAIGKNFRATGKTLIDGLTDVACTNVDDGMRLGKLQLDGAPKRDKALKVAVLFTDGSPTAFADDLRRDGADFDFAADAYPTTPDFHGRSIAATRSSLGGLFGRDEGIETVGFNATPLRLPRGSAVTGRDARGIGIAESEAWAAAIRTAGYTVYSVGLGDPSGAAGEVPDLDLLKRLANDDGVVSSAQPVGEMMFAPSSAELDATFARLANRILARLAR